MEIKKPEEYLSNSNPCEYIRYLLLLNKNQPDQKASSKISKALCYMLTRKNGLVNLINASLNLDETSQKITTINQRIISLSAIVAGLPVLDCTLDNYFKSICSQLINLLLTSNQQEFKSNSTEFSKSINSLYTNICIFMLKKNNKLFYNHFLSYLFDPFHKTEIKKIDLIEKTIFIEDSISIFNILLLNNFFIHQSSKLFKKFFYLRCLLYKTKSHLNFQLDNILKEFIKSFQNSKFLIDETLFLHFNELKKFKIKNDVEKGIITAIYQGKEKDKDNQFKLEIENIDNVTQYTLELISNQSESYIIDIFLLFLQRLSSETKNLLLFSLIDSLQEKVISCLINYPEKAIEFVNLTLERLILKYEKNIFDISTSVEAILEDENQDLENIIKLDSLNMCLQIIDCILEKQLFKDLFENLSQILEKFSNTIIKMNIEKEIIERVKSLQKKLKSKNYIENNSWENNEEFHQAIKDLNSKLIPDRAHALITLKKLIYCKNNNIKKNKLQLISILKECLMDEDSYIYLAAINTLAALALHSPDLIIPILINEYMDKTRISEDRVKIGQVLINLSKQLNEMAHLYAKQLMNCFLNTCKEECNLIKISSISNLAELCSVLKYKLNVYISEIMICIEYTMKPSSATIEVKRACTMFFHLLLNKLDENCLISIEDELKKIYHLLKTIYSTTIDSIIQLHAQLALEQLDRIVREILKTLSNKTLIKQIKI